MSIASRISSAYRALVSPPKAKPIEASHDAARATNWTQNLWANADSLDADAANSLPVRRKLRNQSRYERANSGPCAGIVSTQANYVIGQGPKLRMQTKSDGFNSMVEEAWERWAKAVNLPSKLRTLNMAKTGDGEAVALLVQNPGIPDQVKLDVVPVECDRLTAPVMKADDEQYVDGVWFDEFGNPTAYDILDRHPGSQWASGTTGKYKTYPAKFVCHWFTATRPGQHRGVPDIAPSLNTFGVGRRYREAVLAAAETAANFTAVMEIGIGNDGAEQVAPFSTLPIEKNTFVATPAGASLHQLKAEQPTTTYEMFNRNLVCDQARPLNMPYNIAACDSSGYSYSGGQLDHLTFFVSVNVEQQDGEQMVMNKVKAAWFPEAVLAYGWRVPADIKPKASWGWAGRPKNDPVKTADARQTELANGIPPSEHAAEDGKDWEDRKTQAARDYGITTKEWETRLLESVLQKSGGAPETPPSQNGNGQTNRVASLTGGNGR